MCKYCIIHLTCMPTMHSYSSTHHPAHKPAHCPSLPACHHTCLPVYTLFHLVYTLSLPICTLVHSCPLCMPACPHTSLHCPPASNNNNAHSSPSEDGQHPGPVYWHQPSKGLFPLLYNSSILMPTCPANFYSFYSHLQCCNDDDCPLQPQQIDTNTCDDNQPKGSGWSCFVVVFKGPVLGPQKDQGPDQTGPI